MSKFQQNWCLKIMDKICEKEISIPFQDKSVRNKYLDPDFAASIHLETDLTQIRKKLKNGTITMIDQWGQEMRSFWSYACKSLPRGPLQAMACDLSAYFEKKYENHPRCKNEEWLKEFIRAKDKLEDLVSSYPNRTSHDDGADTEYIPAADSAVKMEETAPQLTPKVTFIENPSARAIEEPEVQSSDYTTYQAPIIARDPRLNKQVEKPAKIDLFTF